jgi:hypothetical protein
MSKRPINEEDQLKLIGGLQALAAILYDMGIHVFQFAPEKGIYWLLDADCNVDPERLNEFSDLIVEHYKKLFPVPPDHVT